MFVRGPCGNGTKDAAAAAAGGGDGCGGPLAVAPAAAAELGLDDCVVAGAAQCAANSSRVISPV